MTIRELRAAAERRTADTSERTAALVRTLTLAAARKRPERCAVCAAATGLEPAFALPVTYIASRLVLSGLEASYRSLPLRTGFLCERHRDHFQALFVDVADPKWDVGRLEQRAEVVGGVVRGGLLVFGGAKAVRIAEEFHAAMGTLKQQLPPR